MDDPSFDIVYGAQWAVWGAQVSSAQTWIPT